MAVLIGGFLFSGVGVVALGWGKRQGSVHAMLCGAALMVYPYFVSNVWAVYGLGVGLTGWLLLGGD